MISASLAKKTIVLALLAGGGIVGAAQLMPAGGSSSSCESCPISAAFASVGGLFSSSKAPAACAPKSDGDEILEARYDKNKDFDKAKPVGNDEQVKKPKADKPAKGGPKVGEMAPAWEAADRTGKTVALEQLRGKVVLMDFWATWCPPCIAAMPHIQSLHAAHEKDGLVVLGMNTWQDRDAKGDPAKFMDDNKYTYGLVMKTDDIAKTYGVRGIPAFFVIGRDGKVVYVGSGAGKKTEEALDKAVISALGAKPAADKPSEGDKPKTEPTEKKAG